MDRCQDHLLWRWNGNRPPRAVATSVDELEQSFNAGKGASWNGLAWPAPGDPQPVQQVVRGAAKVGRNDPCPCGSGKNTRSATAHKRNSSSSAERCSASEVAQSRRTDPPLLAFAPSQSLPERIRSLPSARSLFFFFFFFPPWLLRSLGLRSFHAQSEQKDCAQDDNVVRDDELGSIREDPRKAVGRF